MACTDATGAATPLGICKFNTSADAPSGLGENAIIDQIDALLAARVTKPSGIVSGEVPVWNGSGWDRSSVTRVGASSLGSGTPDATKFLRGDSSWQVVNTPTYATTLPGSPTDGQEVILVDSTTTPTYQWRFRYNAGSGNTDKWEFIGGIPVLLSDFVNAANSTLTQVGVSGFYYKASTLSFAVPRAGRYNLRVGMFIDNNGDGNTMGFGPFAGSSMIINQTTLYTSGTFDATAGHSYPLGSLASNSGPLAASTVVGVAAQVAAKKQMWAYCEIVPVRVS